MGGDLCGMEWDGTGLAWDRDGMGQGLGGMGWDGTRPWRDEMRPGSWPVPASMLSKSVTNVE